jgi:GNAT superfamily N-acetyltransferase
MTSTYTIRDAAREDVARLVAFALEEAREAEGVTLDPDGVARGVGGAFDDPSLARYWVAEDTGGDVIAAASVVTEWSNFYGGQYWWVQSLFVVPEHRGTGLVARLLDHLADRALAAGALSLRLYVHRLNGRAIRVYRRCAFEEAPYTIMRRDLRPRTP